MKNNLTKAAVILYLICFAVNMAFVIDRDDFFLPTHVIVFVSGGISGGFGSRAVYREGLKYYLSFYDEKFEITRNEYKYCVGSIKDQKEYYDKTPDRVICDGLTYSYEIKYPFMKAKTFSLGYNSGTISSRMYQLYRSKKEPQGTEQDIVYALERILDEYNADSAYAFSSNGEKSDRIVFRTGIEDKDEIFKETVDEYMAEFVNLYLYSYEYTKDLYIGRDTDKMEKIISETTGKEPGDFLFPEKSNMLRMDVAYGSQFINRKDRYLTPDMRTYMEYRYFEPVPKGRHMAFFEKKTNEDLTVMVCGIPKEKRIVLIVFRSNDRLTKQMMIAKMKLAILTNGKITGIRGSYYVIHALFIGAVQTSILAAFLIARTLIQEDKKRSAPRK